MQPARPHRGPTESPSACSCQEAAPKQKPRLSSALGPRQPGMAGRESWAWDAGQWVQGLPGTVQAQPINLDRRQEGCADPFRLRATRHSREEMGPQRHPGEPLAQGGELRMLCPQPGDPQAPCHSNTGLAINPIIFIQVQIQLPLPCCWIQHGHPLPHSSLQPLCCCPLRENQKHEYLKPGDEADTERIQAHPSPAPSTVQEGTRSFCGSQRRQTHVPVMSSCCWLAGLCRGEQRC